jgi:hypothetical protein
MFHNNFIHIWILFAGFSENETGDVTVYNDDVYTMITWYTQLE